MNNIKKKIKEYGRLIFLLGLVVLFLTQKPLQEVILNSMSDAYISVGVFVAATLFVYYFIESFFGFDISNLKNKSSFKQISVASALGALPGCGGAIIVVSQYAAGRVRFSSFVAVLISTMGDAAFLLLAKDPKVGFTIIIIGFTIGLLTGLFVDFIHSKDFLMQPVKTNSTCEDCERNLNISSFQKVIWLTLFFIALPFTVLSSFQVEVGSISIFGLNFNPVVWVGSLATFVALFMWTFYPLFLKRQKKQIKENKSVIVSKVITDTNFIIVWVLLAFLLFEIFIFYTGISLEGFFDGKKWLAPLVAIGIGLIPGCGPQIIVSNLYLQGIIPFSALVGNAISNDGDALFPALALTPKAAIVATLYSTIPAFLISYSIYFFT